MESITQTPTDIDDTITAQLVRLMQLCEQHGLHLDRLIAEARHLHSGEPDIEESG